MVWPDVWTGNAGFISNSKNILSVHKQRHEMVSVPLAKLWCIWVSQGLWRFYRLIAWCKHSTALKLYSPEFSSETTNTWFRVIQRTTFLTWEMDGYSKASSSREPPKALQCNSHFCCTEINPKANNSPCDSLYSMFHTSFGGFCFFVKVGEKKVKSTALL